MKLLRPYQKGLTLIELMIVIAIIALLASIAIPGFISARNVAQRSSLLNEVRQNAQALQLFASDNAGRMPPTPAATAVVPDGLASYLPRTSTWDSSHVIGATWGWLNIASGGPGQGNASLLLQFAGANATIQEHALAIDRALDDGSLTTGEVQFSPGTNLLVIGQ